MAISVNAGLVVWCYLYLRQSRESDIEKGRIFRVFLTSPRGLYLANVSETREIYCFYDKGAISMWFTSKYNSQQLVVCFFFNRNVTGIFL